MYSHDTYGLGHIRRTMSIASQLRQPNINILILTGSPIAGRFTFSSQVDFVRIPGMIKHTNEEYRPLSIKIDPLQALRIRKNIITATAKTFRPDLFIVDKEPLGLKKEVLPTLEWLKKHLPRSRSILGLRDVMDDRVVVRRDWEKKGIYRMIDMVVRRWNRDYCSCVLTIDVINFNLIYGKQSGHHTFQAFVGLTTEKNRRYEDAVRRCQK